MEHAMNLFGLPTTVLDFTNDLSPLFVGLVCLVGLSGGMIVWSAVRHYWLEKTKPVPRMVPTSVDHRDAA
jgi:hypothetical protein